jgi:SOS-response transcriptional repressor LexA
MTYSPGPKRLAPATRRVLQAIHDLAEDHGRPPSIVEIRDHVRLRAQSTVHRHLCTLARLGLIHDPPGTIRGRYVTPAGRATLGLEVAMRDVVAHLQEASRSIAALDAERIDHPYAWAVEALSEIAEQLEVPA